MDRIEFLNSIDLNGKPLAYLVTNYLDQSMLIYNLINHECNVRVTEDTGRSISFQIDFKTKKQSDDLLKRLNPGVKYKVYEKEMNLNYRYDNSSVFINLF